MANEKPAAAPAPAAAAAADAAAGGKKKAGMKMVIAAVAVLVLEGATVGITVKLASGPRPVIAEEVKVAPKAAVEKDAEVKLVDAKLPNNQGVKQSLYDLQVVVKVSEKNKAKVTELFAEKDAEIRDQIRTIIASSDSESLAEPGLETLRRKISFQIEKDIGKELIKEVLIPKCTPFSY